ncbi:MAG: DUF3488 and transglutaminase-like domain-containing protein [Planctomycetaceae bacterium]|jgi:hypothetical protein|nr:DUF3488 and transglutaminase-like domain-containing protein [Planctomycetaceae bacterium]
MRSFFNLAIILSATPCLSTLMLGIGQDDIFLPILMLVAACMSLYLTDYKRLIRLGDWTVNVLILAIVFLTIGDILRHWGEALAISIVRTLVFVEIVLLFREKDSKLCWQILLISLLQVLVASAMQQSMLFGFLLIIYLFFGLCTLTLIFLRSENLYYQHHSFAPSLYEIVREEIAARQDYGRLVRLALITLITGPIALAMSFSPRKSDNQNTAENETEKNNRQQQNERWDLLRSFFAVFAKDSKDKTNITNSNNSKRFAEKNSFAAHNQLGDNGTISERTWVQAPIRRNKRSKKYTQNKNSNKNSNSDNQNRDQNQNANQSRYPFFNERAAFSAGTMYPIGLAGGWQELFFRLIRSTLLVVIAAAVLFFIIPRIGKIDFWQLNWTFGNSRWETAFIPRVGVIGFREEIRLGSLGAILPYHSEVMTVKFSKVPDKRIPTNDTNLIPYNEIIGGSLYFRGIALTKYSNGVWNPQEEQSVVSQIMSEYNNNKIEQQRERKETNLSIGIKSIQAIIETINNNADIYINSIYGGGNVIENSGEENDGINKTQYKAQYEIKNSNNNSNNNSNGNKISDRERSRQQRRAANRDQSNLTFRRQTKGEIEKAPLNERERLTKRRVQMFFNHPLFGVRPGEVVESGDGAELFFGENYDLVQLIMSIQPLDTSVFFAPWPFFMIDDNFNRHGSLTYSHGRLHEMRLHGSRQIRQIYTTCFKRGNQMQLIPCQEPFMLKDMLQIPEEGLEKLISLAKKWDQESGLPQADIIGRAKFLESQFLESNQFRYQLGGTKRDYDLDPLEDFISKNNYGHCEYFAGALAIMLRSVGIGARVIVGFKTEAVKLPSNDISCLIRQSDAHSWVEAFIPHESLPNELVMKRVNSRNGNNKGNDNGNDSGNVNDDNNNNNRTINAVNTKWWDRGGWLRLDPTPSSAEDTIMKRFSFRLTDFINTIKEFWNYGVLNMNSERQTTWIYKPIGSGWKYFQDRVFNVEFWKSVIPAVVNYYKVLLFSGMDSNTVWRMQDRLLVGFFFVLVIIFSVLVVLLVWKMYQKLLCRHGGAARNRATVDFYLRMEYLLSKYNRSRFPYETPLEYIRSISPFETTVFILNSYYNVKYGGEILSVEELKKIKISLDKLEHELEKK